MRRERDGAYCRGSAFGGRLEPPKSQGPGRRARLADALL